jgi:NAD(P)-dependent dehydrogenase (short-subunit alcohol dehydrogenase family)
MKDKVVLVTGANGGLGTSVTQAFLQAGARVIGTSRKIEKDAFKHPNFSALAADLSDPQVPKRLLDHLLSQFGKLDILAHTVGGFAGGQSIADTDEATLQQMLEMNLNSTFRMLHAVIPIMRKQRTGRIIAVASRAALEPGANVGAYSASKAAMLSLVRTAALENQDAGITVNAVLPGTIDTPSNRTAMPNADFSKWVRPENIASLMVWLAGDAGRDVTGAVIPVYGPA